MRKTLVLWLHVAHVALLLVAALVDRPDGPSTQRRPDALDARRLPELDPHCAEAMASGAAGVVGRPDASPYYSMPVWRPDPPVRCAATAIGPDRTDQRTSEAALYVSPHAHAAAPR
jgi:hypothetical protein